MKIRESNTAKPTYLSLSRDLSSSMRLRRSSSRCSRKRCAASACCLSSSNFRCRSSFCLSRTSFALSNSFELPVDSRPANSRIEGRAFSVPCVCPNRSCGCSRFVSVVFHGQLNSVAQKNQSSLRALYMRKFLIFTQFIYL